MISGTTAESVCKELCNCRETTFREMKQYLSDRGITLSQERKQAFSAADLPNFALLSLETPRCWHWSLYAEGVFYDPEHGVLTDFPQSERKFYWQIFI